MALGPRLQQFWFRKSLLPRGRSPSPSALVDGLLFNLLTPVSWLFRLLVAIALRWGLNPNDLKLVTALFVLAALVLPQWLQRRARPARSVPRARGDEPRGMSLPENRYMEKQSLSQTVSRRRVLSIVALAGAGAPTPWTLDSHPDSARGRKPRTVESANRARSPMQRSVSSTLRGTVLVQVSQYPVAPHFSLHGHLVCGDRHIQRRQFVAMKTVTPAYQRMHNHCCTRQRDQRP